MGGQPVATSAPLKGQRGLFLVDSMGAVGLVGLIFGPLLAGVSLAARGTDTVAEQVTASLLSRSQIESIKDAIFIDPPQPYPSVTAPPGYTVENTAAAYPGGDSNIQTVTVRVLRGGGLVSEIEVIKVNR